MPYDPHKWENLQKRLRTLIGKEPSEEGILILLGLDRLGFTPGNLEEKEVRYELIQLGICVLLEKEGFYREKEKDAQGWPVFEAVRPLPRLEEHEAFLRELIINYFCKIWEL